MIEEISEALADIPGIVTSVEQPLAHLISHMLSGVKAQVAIKLYGDDLDELRRQAEGIQAAIDDIPGIRDLQVEQQVIIPQLRIEADGEKLKAFGLRRSDVNEFVETAMQGEVVSQVLDGQRTFDLMVRLGEEFREDLDALKRLQIDLPGGGSVKLEDVARVYKAGGPNTVNREQVRRRIVVQCNVSDRGLVDVVGDIKERLEPLVAELPPGYFVEYGGQFESQQSASRMIAILFALAWWACSCALQDVSLGQPCPASDGRTAHGVHRQRGVALSDRPDPHGRQHGRFHLAVRHRLAQRHSADQSLPAPGEIRGGKLDARNDRPSRQGSAGTGLDDRTHVGHRPRTAGTGSGRAGQRDPLSGGDRHHRRTGDQHAARVPRSPRPVLDHGDRFCSPGGGSWTTACCARSGGRVASESRRNTIELT